MIGLETEFRLLNGVRLVYVDIHIHALYGVDDGAKSEKEMLDILDAAYADGTRVVCLTPHFHLGYFGDNIAALYEAGKRLELISSTRYPNMQFFIGNELRYSPVCLSWLREEACLTLNGTRHVLIDFSYDEELKTIVSGLESILNSGYVPMLAHAERYLAFYKNIKALSELRDNGVIVQIDARSVFGDYGKKAEALSKKLLQKYLVDVVASDAHDIKGRPPKLSDSYEFVSKKYGKEYADALFYHNPLRLLGIKEDNYE